MDYPSLARRRLLFSLLLVSFVALGGGSAVADSGSGSSGSGGGESDGGGEDGGNDDGDNGDDDGGDDDGGDDSDIRNAVKSGDALPLAEVLASVRRAYKGEIVHIGVAVVRGRYRYLIRMIDEESRLIEIVVDAKSKRVLRAGGV